MSASMEEVPVRVKLFFDNLPLPCSWVLVKTKKCPKVKDFLTYVRRKFMPQRDGSLSILINGCTVPEWEKSSIFREDDIVHLYFKEITHVSMVSDRLIIPEEYTEIYNKDKDLRKKKKKSKEESTSIQSKETERNDVEAVVYISGDEEHQTKKKRKISTEKWETLEDEDMTPDRSTNHTEDTVKPDKKKRTRKRKRRREEAAPAATVSNNSINVKPLRQQADLNSNMHIKFTSDNEDEESCTMLDSSRTRQDVLEQEEESLRTSTPVYHKHGDQTVDLTYSESPSAIDRPIVTQSVLANGVAVFSRPRSRQIKSNSFRELTKEQQLSTKLTNRSFVLQNTSLSNGKEEHESALLTCPQRSSSNSSPVIAIPVRREYQQFPLLQGSPNPGDKIAFKMLEMSENYTPEVGDYKEAEVVSFNSTSQIVEMKISPGFNKERTLGKFDVDLNDEETDMNSEETMVETHPLTSLMEVRLITE